MVHYALDVSFELAEHIANTVRPPVPLSEPIAALITHYGESYNGQTLGCGTGYYRSGNPEIVAVGPGRYGQMPCGTELQICGDGGCIIAQRHDACPGCSPDVFDLSESGFQAVCGIPTGVCSATVSIVATCDDIDLAWGERPTPPLPQRTPHHDLAEAPLLGAGVGSAAGIDAPVSVEPPPAREAPAEPAPVATTACAMR